MSAIDGRNTLEDIIFTQLLQWWNYNLTSNTNLHRWKAFQIVSCQKWFC